MTSKGRSSAQVLFIAALIGTAACDGWAGWQWMTARTGLEASFQDLAVCQGLSDQITLLRQAPAKIDEQVQSRETIAKLVESATLAAGVSADHIVHVAPAPPRRLRDTPYTEQLTSVELREVTLRQLVAFTQSVCAAAPRLELSSANVRTPAADSTAMRGQELWNVELTLTTHVYAPKMPAPP